MFLTCLTSAGSLFHKVSYKGMYIYVLKNVAERDPGRDLVSNVTHWNSEIHTL